MKHKQHIYIDGKKFKVLFTLLSESVYTSIRKCGSLFWPFFFSFYKYNKECPLKTFEKFSMHNFEENGGKRLTASAYMEVSM